MLHLYALADHPAQPARIDGIDGAELRTVAMPAGVDAVVSDVVNGQRPPAEAAILAHAAVVEELASLNDAVLPARFSGGYSDDDALADAIKAREPRIREALERVRGCVEIGLRVFDSTAPIDGATPGSGRAYMQSRLEEVRSAERTAAELHDSLSAAARATTSSVLASPQLVLSAAYLLPRDEVESFRAGIEEAERARPGLTFVCTGPWPAYSFALIEPEAP
jgi:Gas vesicle synthesis protein GvpL/GvpF